MKTHDIVVIITATSASCLALIVYFAVTLAVFIYHVVSEVSTYVRRAEARLGRRLFRDELYAEMQSALTQQFLIDSAGIALFWPMFVVIGIGMFIIYVPILLTFELCKWAVMRAYSRWYTGREPVTL